MRKKFWSLLILSAFTAALLLPSTVLATPIAGADADVGAFLYGGGTFDDTSDANSADADDVSWPVSMETIYIGGTFQFNKIFIYVSAESVASEWSIPEAGNMGAFQYYDGSSWTPITVTNSTGIFNSTGIHQLTLTPPGDWAATTVNESSSNYFLRVACDNGCNQMTGSFDIDQISLLTYSGAPATPEFSTYALMITLGITGFMVFKQTKMNGGLSQA